MRRMYSEMQLTTLIKNAIANGLLENTDVSAKSLYALSVSGESIIENMEGYEFSIRTEGVPEHLDLNIDYAGVVKNGNKLTFVVFGSIERTDTISPTYLDSAFRFVVPKDVASKLYPSTILGWDNSLAYGVTILAKGTYSNVSKPYLVRKFDDIVGISLFSLDDLTANTPYIFRIEQTFLLSDNLAE